MAPTDRRRQPALTWAEVTARRLDRQGLAAPRDDGDLPGVVAAMCGAHAQIMSAAERSVALRLTAATPSARTEAGWSPTRVRRQQGVRRRELVIYKQNWLTLRHSCSWFSGQSSSQDNNGAVLNGNSADLSKGTRFWVSVPAI